tara:strand:+ start:16291 stop:17310 length:1020 start_codon:yes stop_codon:yes gene_type:complete
MAKEQFTMVETPSASRESKITIRPYFDARSENMGLENYGLSLFDGIKHQEQLACLEINGINRYLTGLNEFAPEVKKLSKEAREAKVRQIRESVADLEAELASNILDPEDKDFWNKVKLLKPDNNEFWNKIDISVGNEPLFLNMSDPYDRIKLHAIEAGGFSLIAKSYEDAKAKPRPPKFYLDKDAETVSSRTEYKKLRNKALSELQKLFDKNSTKLFYVAKVVDASSTQYKKSTPLDILYENMDTYIHGDGAESNMERAVNTFLDVVNSDMESLKIRSIVKDSSFFKYIITKSDGHIYHNKKNVMLGRNVSDTVEFLKNPLNEDVLDDLTKECENYWKS